jgi:hypothetical protein
MPVTTEYAKVIDGIVTQVIVADATFIASLPDAASWHLTPYDAQTGAGKVGIGFSYANGIFIGFMDAQYVAGEPAKISGSLVAMSVNGSPTYQWRKDTVNIEGATSASYLKESPVPGDSGSYDCVVTVSGQTANSPAKVVTVPA